MIDFVLNMIDFVLNMMAFEVKLMNFVFKMINLYAWSRCSPWRTCGVVRAYGTYGSAAR